MHETYKKWLDDGCPKVICGCGCNKEIVIKDFHKKYGIPKYIRGHFIRTEEQKKLLSKSMEKEGNPFYGKHHTKESIEKMSKSKKDLYNTDKYTIILSEAHKGIKQTQEANNKHRKTVLEKMSKMTNEEKSKKFGSFGRDNPSFGKPRYHAKRYWYISSLQNEICFRSSYELEYAKYLDSKNILWIYEHKTFDLGNMTYTPDFFLPQFEKFIEIKGFMSKKCQIKIDKFLEQYHYNLEVLYKKDLIKLGIKI